ncbi:MULTISPECIES: hypothetical protein [unclassified Mycobacterium]|uniref:hypothetical protein n=1 Tax=unclassified Mycobacterium TaxID=2642494 RepID=UPI00073FC21A|nr:MULTISPECIES: hypothetical protein [unclassified Mycobacterium]KUH81417.1 hypothetical protein AU185_16195 [Mycobacterium sp. GA-0227b]KUH83547.1 hypothetical protein AU186_15885 [Mycobacterium sp. GA-1999]
MSLNLKELKEWPPEIADLAQSAREAAANHSNSAELYRSLITVSTWEGKGADAAKSAMTATASDHDGLADNLGSAATRMELVHKDAEDLAETIKRILDDAATQPVVVINESTNQVIPPDTSHMTEEYAAQVAAKVTDLQERISAALADGERIDADLAGAITAASGTTEPAVKTASSLEELLLPQNGEQRKEPKPGEPSSPPDSLDSALDQLTGEPGHQPGSPTADDVAAAPAGPLPMDPAKVEQFKNLARQAMLRDGVPPEQIEQRLDAIVAAAQKPLPASKPTEYEAVPPPSVSDGFAEGWFNTEESIKGLIGANGWEEFKDSWSETAKGTWERITNPVDSWTEEIEHLTKYPGHYFGELAGETAITAPGAMFGGEAALAAHGARAAIPDDVIDTPSAPGTVDQPTPLSPSAGDQSPPAVWDYSDGYSPDAPAVASSLNEAYVNGQPTVELARQVADLSTHHMPSPNSDTGNADRVVLGKWAGPEDGYIGEARKNGGIYYDTGPDTWSAIGHGLSRPEADALGWQVNEQFLKTQLEGGVPRIDYVVEGTRFSSVEDVIRTDPNSFSAKEIKYLIQNAPAYGYERIGNSWVRVGS